MIDGVSHTRRLYAADLLAGRVAVVTGGGSGIGSAVAAAFAAVGADVVIASRSAERLESTAAAITEAAGRPCAGMPCDVRDADAVRHLREFVTDRFGPASIVVNNAAGNFRIAAERMTERALRTVLDIDLIGTATVTRTFFPDLAQSGHGSVLSMVIPAAERGLAGFAHAAAAKAGIVSLTCSWAREWGPHGVRANSIAPGAVPTPGVTAHMLGQDASAGKGFANLLEAVPLGRLGTPEDIASAAVFLCSDAASWISGANLIVDGGFNANPSP